MRRLLVPGLLALTMMVPATAQAEPCIGANLQTLIDSGASCTEGDKIFSNFTASFVSTGDNTNPADASGIEVTSFTDSDSEHGLTFQGGFFAGVDSSLDVLIGYTVTSVGNLITDIHLAFNGSVFGTGFATVVETARDPNAGGAAIGQIEVFNPPPVLTADLDLDYAVQTVDITKDIFLFGGADGFATISFIDQVITQQVPEPGSLLLFGLGLFGSAAALRRRNRQTA